jgi:hypothetical protein
MKQTKNRAMPTRPDPTRPEAWRSHTTIDPGSLNRSPEIGGAWQAMKNSAMPI